VVRSIPKEMRPPVRDHSTPEAGLLKESRGFIITTATRTFLLKRSFQNEGLVLIQYLATVNLTVPNFIQADCIKEALSYVNYKRDWFRHPALRFERLAKMLTNRQLQRMSFPSSAFQILLGGKIWPSGKYLNFVRHTGFLYADVIDTVNFNNPRKALIEIANKIDNRFFSLQSLMKKHLEEKHFELSFDNIIPYWGIFYLSSFPKERWKIKVWDDPSDFSESSSKLRDLYHYKSMLQSKTKFDLLIVANTNFERYTKETIGNLPIKIISAQNNQDIFAKEMKGSYFR